MTNKPAPRNWNDVQTVLATMAMALTLGLWNLFAGPDRALAKNNDQAAVVPPIVPPTEQPNLVPTPLPQIKIMLGGAAPQLANQPSQPGQVPTTPGHHTGGGGIPNPPPAAPPPPKGGGGGTGGS